MPNNPTFIKPTDDPEFIPLTLEQLKAGIDDSMVELLRSVLHVEAFERELMRLNLEKPEQEQTDIAA